MKHIDPAYRKLQRHLDKQAIGYPATRSGAEIKILEHIFNPEEAEIATHLSYKFEPIEKIFQRVGELVSSIDELEGILIGICKKGGVEYKAKDGKMHYCCLPLVFGMYEGQNKRLTHDFIKNYKIYVSDKKFGIDFLSTKLPQMRTIPIEKSIKLKHQVSDFDDIKKLLYEYDGPYAITECICRKKNSIEGKKCKATDRVETCLGVGHLAQIGINNDIAREISRSEAISIIEQNQKEGLILQPSNSKQAEFICSCCGCCCGMLSTHKKLPKPLQFWAANFFASVNSGLCIGCGVCEDTCQVNAIKVNDEEQRAFVNNDRCLGCGNCVVNCPEDAIKLAKRAQETVPPETREDLHDIIMENKKGPIGKLLLTGKLITDTIRAR
jgi:Na+-translocating ferredoxin:NAD+ oxidoreductase subunit B